MSGNTRTIVRAGAAVLLLLAIAGTAVGQEGGDGGAEKVVFTIGNDNDIDSMNPAVGLEEPAYFMFATNYDLLVNFASEDLSPYPGLAEDWEVSGNGLTWTFHIREGVEWSDGEPLTAHDVAYTYNRTLRDRIGNWISYLKLIDHIEVVDDHTVEITTKAPTTSLLTAYVYILPEHVFRDVSKQELKTFENFPDPVTSGPFRVVEWEKGQFFRMEANPNYWAGAPKVDEVVYRFFNNEDALAQALRAGEVDFADTLGANIYDSFADEPNIETNEASIPSFEEIGFNSGADETQPGSDGHPALKDVAVRRAISMAIDRDVLLERVVNGYGQVGTTIVPPALSFYHYEPTEDELLGFDPDAAEQLLDEAGYRDTDDDGVREMPGGGRPLQFRYFVRSEDEGTVTASQFVTEWLAEIGIDTTVRALTDTKLTDVIYEGNYDMFHWGWFPDPDPDFILSVMTCEQRPPDGVWSDSFYCNPEYERLYNRQKKVLDLDERAEVVKEMQRIVYNDAPYVVLYFDSSLQAYRSDKWTGFVQQPEEGGDLLGAYGPFSMVSIEPISGGARQTTAQESAGGLSGAVWIAIIAGVIVVVGGAMAIRRRGGSEDRA
jgi:peptide/nickel transport system substrate-binding protein